MRPIITSILSERPSAKPEEIPGIKTAAALQAFKSFYKQPFEEVLQNYMDGCYSSRPDFFYDRLKSVNMAEKFILSNFITKINEEDRDTLSDKQLALLGYAYLNGVGVNKNAELAEVLLQAAVDADDNNCIAIHLLGFAANAAGNKPLAKNYYQRSADLGFGYSHYNLITFIDDDKQITDALVELKKTYQFQALFLTLMKRKTNENTGSAIENLLLAISCGAECQLLTVAKILQEKNESIYRLRALRELLAEAECDGVAISASSATTLEKGRSIDSKLPSYEGVEAHAFEYFQALAARDNSKGFEELAEMYWQECNSVAGFDEGKGIACLLEANKYQVDDDALRMIFKYYKKHGDFESLSYVVTFFTAHHASILDEWMAWLNPITTILCNDIKANKALFLNIFEGISEEQGRGVFHLLKNQKGASHLIAELRLAYRCFQELSLSDDEKIDKMNNVLGYKGLVEAYVRYGHEILACQAMPVKANKDRFFSYASDSSSFDDKLADIWADSDASDNDYSF